MTPDADAGSQAVRLELRRIVASPQFEDADRLVRFLSFVVEETLAGRGDVLKESVIGVEVFGRPAGYDPKADPIVRVQARRLRGKLEAWYQAGGQSSGIRIALPKGGYTPEFGPPPAQEPVSAVPVPVPVPKARSAWTLMWFAAPLLVGTAAVVLMMPKTKPAAAPGSRLFTAYAGYQTSPAFSPDGLTLAFSWGGPDGDNVDIYVQSLDADTPRRLTTAPERDRSPVWLPDGQHIGFLRDNGPDGFALMIAPTLGAGERRVAEIRGNPGNPPRIEWSRDGKKVYASEPMSPGAPQQIVEISLEPGAH
jgi:hypothetical protein